MKGLTISKGDAYTNNLKMIGPAATIEITGRTGLADQDYDQNIYITPKLSGNLPVIGGLAGGPQVGVGLFIADKVFGKKLNKMSKSQYSIQGTWEKPIIKKVKKKRKRRYSVDDADEDN